MFGGLFNAGSTSDARQNTDGVAETSHTAEQSSQQAATGFNLWGVAATLSNTVKARAEGLVKSVQETDWKGELLAFGHEVKGDADKVKHKAEEVVLLLPKQAESLSRNFTQTLAGVSGGEAIGTTARVPQQQQQQEVSAMGLNNVGVSLSSFSKSLFVGSRELFDQVRDAVEGEIAVATKETKRGGRGARATASASAAARLADVPVAKYNRFDSEVSAMQRDSSTYCDEPEDKEDYLEWHKSFSLECAQGDVARLLVSNIFMAELQSRIVPIVVEEEDFWSRYFYRLHKLKQKEEQRLLVAQRAKEQVDEDLDGWGDDDDDKDDDEDGRGAVAAAEKGGAKSSGGAADIGADELLALLCAEGPAGGAAAGEQQKVVFQPGQEKKEVAEEQGQERKEEMIEKVDSMAASSGVVKSEETAPKKEVVQKETTPKKVAATKAAGVEGGGSESQSAAALVSTTASTAATAEAAAAAVHVTAMHPPAAAGAGAAPAAAAAATAPAAPAVAANAAAAAAAGASKEGSSSNSPTIQSMSSDSSAARAEWDIVPSSKKLEGAPAVPSESGGTSEEKHGDASNSAGAEEPGEGTGAATSAKPVAEDDNDDDESVDENWGDDWE